jgi:hypothetical protein
MPNRFNILGRRNSAAVVLSIIFVSILAIARAQAEKLNSLDHERARDMLRVVQDDIKKYYYDPKFLNNDSFVNHRSLLSVRRDTSLIPGNHACAAYCWFTITVATRAIFNKLSRIAGSEGL